MGTAKGHSRKHIATFSPYMRWQFNGLRLVNENPLFMKVILIK
jgi:hypothetical protein